MINSSLFDKYKDLEFKEPDTLVELDLRVAKTHKVCPYCFCRLYKMMDRPFFYCRSKKNKHKFVISEAKLK